MYLFLEKAQRCHGQTEGDCTCNPPGTDLYPLTTVLCRHISVMTCRFLNRNKLNKLQEKRQVVTILSFIQEFFFFFFFFFFSLRKTPILISTAANAHSSTVGSGLIFDANLWQENTWKFQAGVNRWKLQIPPAECLGYSVGIKDRFRLTCQTCSCPPPHLEEEGAHPAAGEVVGMTGTKVRIRRGWMPTPSTLQPWKEPRKLRKTSKHRVSDICELLQSRDRHLDVNHSDPLLSLAIAWCRIERKAIFSETKRKDVSGPTKMLFIVYPHEKVNAVEIYCPMEGGGHCWPQGHSPHLLEKWSVAVGLWWPQHPWSVWPFENSSSELAC